MDQLLRHIRACNNAVLPGDRIPVHVAGQRVGYVKPAHARVAAANGATLADHLTIPPDALQPVARALADARAGRWRDEAFDVRAAADGPVLGQIDRGALPALGLRSVGVHLNGLVGDQLWVARRAAHKALDPGKLDHLVAGGVPAGHTPAQTLVKEAAEEASLQAATIARAVPVATIAYAHDRAEGLRRDTLLCYDLELPPDFTPQPGDDEVEAFELWPLTRVLDAVRTTDAFKFNVNLVLIDLFIRCGLVSPQETATLRSHLNPSEANP